MTPQDEADRFPTSLGTVITPRAKPRMAGRSVLFLGVAGACAMGVGLGLWARPAMTERRASAPPPADLAKAPPVEHRLQILVDDQAVPVRPPLEVMPARAGPAPTIPAPKQLPWAERAPIAPSQGLMKVQALAEPEPTPAAPTPKAAPRTVARPKLAPLTVALLAPKPVTPKAKAPPPAPVRLAKAAPDPKVTAKAHKLELAQAAAAKAAARKLQLAQTARAAKAAHQQQVELAKAEARGRAEARAEAKILAVAQARDDARKRARLVAMAHAFQKLLPHQARPAPVEVARADRKHVPKARHEPRVERASLKTRRPAPRLATPPPMRAHAVQAPPARPSGLMKVSDPGLGAAERQLNRAYQDARAAGVPAAELQRQQQHWLAARSAAAREAPWAVHDVYLARIAELNGQAREARPEGY
jgi:hypothetical protein